MPRALRPEGRVRGREDVLMREMPDGFVLYDARADRVHVLNASARFVWERLDGDHTVAELVAEAGHAAGRAAGEVAEDVVLALRTFESLGLLRDD